MALTQFSKTVSGVAPTGVTGVTVNLLRNNINSSGATVRNQVDTFTATVNSSTGAWTGSFSTHAVSNTDDQVEINYIGGSVTPNPITIGNGFFLPTTLNSNGVATSAIIANNWSAIDSAFWISADGKTLNCASSSVCGGAPFSASVNGGPAQTSPGGGASLTFSTPVKSTDTVTITLTRTSGGTTLTETFPAPQLSIAEQPLTGSYGIQPGSHIITGLPSCAAYLVLNEVVCSNLVPGNYTVTDGSNSQTATVPAAIPTGNTTGQNVQSLFVPNNLGVTIPGLANGQTVTITPAGGTTPVTTLTVHTLTIGATTPLGDLQNGANTTVVGTCSAGLWLGDPGFSGAMDVCGSDGKIPQPNNLAFSNPYSELDETSNGSTNVLLPTIPAGSQAPHHGDSIMTPYTVVAYPRYTDPITAAAAANQLSPTVGQPPVVPSTASADPVTFQYAPLGTTTFTTLGNVNVPGGLTLPATLAKGTYVGRFITTDAGGDFSSFDIQFYVQGPSSAQAPAAPSCTSAAKSTKVQFVRNVASAAKAKKHKKHSKKKHHKKKSKAKTASISCTSSSAGTRVLLTVSKGATVVGTGSGTITSSSTTITIGGLKKGTYGLTEIYYYANGQSSEAGHTLKVS